MPEVLTKYPDIVIRVLQGNDARCGKGVRPRILKHCPREQFCALKTGEICVYGLQDIPKMTQIRAEELAAIVCRNGANTAAVVPVGMESIALVLAFVAGIVLGRFLRWRSGHRSVG